MRNNAIVNLKQSLIEVINNAIVKDGLDVATVSLVVEKVNTELSDVLQGILKQEKDAKAKEEQEAKEPTPEPIPLEPVKENRAQRRAKK